MRVQCIVCVENLTATSKVLFLFRDNLSLLNRISCLNQRGEYRMWCACVQSQCVIIGIISLNLHIDYWSFIYLRASSSISRQWDGKFSLEHFQFLWKTIPKVAIVKRLMDIWGCPGRALTCLPQILWAKLRRMEFLSTSNQYFLNYKLPGLTIDSDE